MSDPNPGTHVVSGFFKRAGERLFDILAQKILEPKDLEKTISKHVERTRQYVGTIKILGMSEPLPVEDVYYPTRVSRAIRRRLYENTWQPLNKHDFRQRRNGGEKAESGLAVIGAEQRVVVLGGPGSGKTTFLKFIALTHSSDGLFESSGLGERYIPFFVHLPLFRQSGGSILEYLTKEVRGEAKFDCARALEALFGVPGCLVLLDSLDEVAESDRAACIREMQAFFKRFPKVRGVVSCRTADYVQTIDGFREVELARLDSAAIEKIVHAWFKAESGSKEGGKKAVRLLEALKSNEDVESLAESPLLLSLICIQFSHDLRIPHRKIELYRRCVEALLSRWDSSRNFRRESKFEGLLTDDRKERLFEYLAEVFFESKGQYVVNEALAHTEIGRYCSEKFQLLAADGEKVAEELERHHGLIERFSADSYCFSHPSFQEYFYARRLDRLALNGVDIAKLAKDPARVTVVEFLVCLREDPRDILTVLISKSKLDSIKNYPAMTLRIRHLVLLYRCLVAGPAIDLDFIKTIYEHIYVSMREIFRIFYDSAIYPLPELRNDGIRHIYFLGEKGRQTLEDALLHLRILSNEILRNPIRGFADFVLEKLSYDKRVAAESPDFLRSFESACVAVPLASAAPLEVIRFLEELGSQVSSGGAISRLHSGSIEVIKKNYSPGHREGGRGQ